MVVNENNPKIWASLIAPNPDDVTYWVDLTADPHGNIIKFYDENDEKWYNLTSPSQTISALLPGSNSILDEFRFSNYAVWTSNFTPPTEPYA